MYKSASGCMEHIKIFEVPNISTILKYLKTKIFWICGFDISGKDAYFYSESHNQQSESYLISNAEVGFKRHKWNMSFWCKNILNQNYSVRGFYFGLEPPDFSDKLYIQWSDPRHYGLTLSYQF